MINVHVEVLEEDQFCSFPGKQHDCMVHRAIMRALGKLGINIASDQLEVNGSTQSGGDRTNGWYFQIMSGKEEIFAWQPLAHDPWAYQVECKLHQDHILDTWNLEIPSVIWWFNDHKMRHNLNLPDVGTWINDFDNGLEVPEFSFDFEMNQQSGLLLEWRKTIAPVAAELILVPA